MKREMRIYGCLALALFFSVGFLSAKEHTVEKAKTEVAMLHSNPVQLEVKEHLKLTAGEYIGAVAAKSEFTGYALSLAGILGIFAIFWGKVKELFTVKRLAFTALIALAVVLSGEPMLGASLAFVPVLDLAGLEGEELAFMQKLQKRFKDDGKKEFTKEEASAIVKEELKKFEKIDAEKLAELMDVEKGVMARLKAIGIEVTTLKENGGPKVKKTLKQILKDAMPEITKFIQNKGLGGAEGYIEISLKSEAQKVAAVMTTANTVDDSDVPDDLVESFSEGQFVATRRPREYVYDIATVTNVGEIEKYKTWLEEGDTQGNFAIVSEGALKPLVSTALVRNVATAKKAAGKYIVTEEVTKWRKKAYTIIQRIMRQQFLRDKANILETDLTALSTPYTASAFDGAVVNPNNFDAIAAVMAQIMSLNFIPDLLVLNPQDKMLTMMSKGEDGHYFVNVPMIDPQGNASILGLTVRTSNKLDVGEFIVGESGLWEIEQEGITIRVGYGVTVTGASPVTAVVSDFDNNQFRVIVEQYFLNYLATPNEGSFVIAQFDTVKAAIELVIP